MTDPQPESPPSAWGPLRQPLFRTLWIATVVSNIGTWIHEVGAGWLMVTLNPHPVMMSLVQAANALSWGLFEDAAVPERYVETFVVESWAEHLRQHHRGTAEDAAIIAKVRGYHRGDDAPQVTHWIAVNAADEAAGDVL